MILSQDMKKFHELSRSHGQSEVLYSFFPRLKTNVFFWITLKFLYINIMNTEFLQFCMLAIFQSQNVTPFQWSTKRIKL